VKPTIEDLFNLMGFPEGHKHRGSPPPDAKVVEKWGSYSGDFERAIKSLGNLRVVPLGKSARYDLYYYYDGDAWVLALAKEKIATKGVGRIRK